MGGYYHLIHVLLVYVLLLHMHGSHSLNQQTCNPTDLEALLAFYDGLDSKGIGLVGWGPNDTTCCSWTGISCHLGRVVGLDLSNKSLNGGISSMVTLLDGLVTLNLSGNSLRGQPPEGLGRLTRLQMLDLSMNMFSGAFPSDLYSLSELKSLSLRGNQLSGSLAEDLGNFSQLVYIDLSFNMFAGVIPDILGGLRSLEFLNLASNSFNGTLPASLSSCSMLRVINLRNNSLSGEISIDFKLLPKLKTLNFGSNKFEGEIPESFKYLRSLLHFSISVNSFTNLSSALRVLQHLPNLTSLVLTKNFRGGETMPTAGISGFKRLQLLALSNCALTGIVPPWMQSLEILKFLDVSWNKLNGKIPPWLGDLNNLFYVDLSNSLFGGELPESFTRMKSLISSSGSSGSDSLEDFPLLLKKNSADKGSQYNHLSSFSPSLILSNNLLVGPVLPGLGHLVNLHVLDLSWNNFSGGIPDELSNMLSLEALNFSHNGLGGCIPASLTKLTFLSKFDVSYNLAGDIPAGDQFSTFGNENFVGNFALCLLRNGSSCSAKAPFMGTGNENRHDAAMIYISVEAGFTLGLLTVWNVLFFARAWRAAYFLAVDRLFDKLYVMTMVKANKLRKKWEDKERP
ncbi:hypothetical protein VPH35_032374 [Triticum aestivum]|uniref:phytosulfokine receptor 1-like n=1 Tax=Triticum aestivum TaxID=4565 RepID=UPI001D0249AD|nr:phytosulfokine receptor 1-like [Triticum aestivum]